MLKLLPLITASCTALLSLACTWERGDDPPCDRCGCGSGIEEMNASEPVECGILVDRSVYCWKASPCYVDVEVPEFPPGRYVRTDYDAAGLRNCALREDGVVLCSKSLLNWAPDGVTDYGFPPTGAVQMSYGRLLYSRATNGGGALGLGESSSGVHLLMALPHIAGYGVYPIGTFASLMMDGRIVRGGIDTGGTDLHDVHFEGDTATSTYRHMAYAGGTLCGLRTDGLIRCESAFRFRCPFDSKWCRRILERPGSVQLMEYLGEYGDITFTDDRANEGVYDGLNMRRLFGNRWAANPLLCGITDDDAIWCGDRAYIDDRFKHVEVYPESVCGLTLDGRIRCYGGEFRRLEPPADKRFIHFGRSTTPGCDFVDGVVTCPDL